MSKSYIHDSFRKSIWPNVTQICDNGPLRVKLFPVGCIELIMRVRKKEHYNYMCVFFCSIPELHPIVLNSTRGVQFNEFVINNENLYTFAIDLQDTNILPSGLPVGQHFETTAFVSLVVDVFPH